jgi:hypothetical protein
MMIDLLVQNDTKRMDGSDPRKEDFWENSNEENV